MIDVGILGEQKMKDWRSIIIYIRKYYYLLEGYWNYPPDAMHHLVDRLCSNS
jgi:hypothetical protein